MDLNNKMTFEEFIDPVKRRKEQMSVKSEAIWVTFHDLDGLINITKFTETYLNRTRAWFFQKLNGLTVCNKPRGFTEDESRNITSALRDIAKRLNQYADDIDKASMS